MWATHFNWFTNKHKLARYFAIAELPLSYPCSINPKLKPGIIPATLGIITWTAVNGELPKSSLTSKFKLCFCHNFQDWKSTKNLFGSSDAIPRHEISKNAERVQRLQTIYNVRYPLKSNCSISPHINPDCVEQQFWTNELHMKINKSTIHDHAKTSSVRGSQK